ncbi:hypothetical protein [Geopseudomonas aromaticivorans]
MCWRDEPHQDSTTLDLLDSLRQAATTPIRAAAGGGAAGVSG